MNEKFDALMGSSVDFDAPEVDAVIGCIGVPVGAVGDFALGVLLLGCALPERHSQTKTFLSIRDWHSFLRRGLRPSVAGEACG